MTDLEYQNLMPDAAEEESPAETKIYRLPVFQKAVGQDFDDEDDEDYEGSFAKAVELLKPQQEAL